MVMFQIFIDTKNPWKQPWYKEPTFPGPELSVSSPKEPKTWQEILKREVRAIDQAQEFFLYHNRQLKYCQMHWLWTLSEVVI